MDGKRMSRLWLTFPPACDILRKNFENADQERILNMQNLQNTVNYMYMYYGRIHL